MKRALALALLAGLASAASPAKKPSPSPVARAVPTATAAEALAGWSDLTWGMSTAQVLTLHPEARRHAVDGLGFPTQVLDEPFDVALHFRNGFLSNVTLEWAALSPDPPQAKEYRRKMDRLEEALTSKYGAANSISEDPTVDQWHERPEVLVRVLLWRAPKTTIELKLTRDEVAAMNQTRYKSSVSPHRLILIYSDASGGNPKGNL